MAFSTKLGYKIFISLTISLSMHILISLFPYLNAYNF